MGPYRKLKNKEAAAKKLLEKKSPEKKETPIDAGKAVTVGNIPTVIPNPQVRLIR